MHGIALFLLFGRYLKTRLRDFSPVFSCAVTFPLKVLEDMLLRPCTTDLEENQNNMADKKHPHNLYLKHNKK